MVLQKLDLGLAVCAHVFSLKGKKKIENLYNIFNSHYLKNDHTYYDFFTLGDINQNEFSNLNFRAIENPTYNTSDNNTNTNEFLYAELPSFKTNTQENEEYNNGYFDISCEDDQYLIIDNNEL